MKRILFILGFLAMVSSCNSDDDSSQQSNFYALTVGNSWVYKYYTKDLNTGGFTVFANRIDSVEIIDTEILNNQTYYTFKTKSTQTENNNIGLPGFEIGEWENISYKRDSLGYLVSNTGNKLYWNNNHEEIFWHSNSDPDSDVFAKLNDEGTFLNIEAGNFECLDMEIYLKNINTNIVNQTASHIYYSEGIGNICEKIGYLNGEETTYERRLDTFLIN